MVGSDGREPIRQLVVAIADHVEGGGLQRASILFRLMPGQLLGLHELLERLVGHLRHRLYDVVLLNEGHELGARRSDRVRLDISDFVAGARVHVRHGRRTTCAGKITRTVRTVDTWSESRNRET